MARLQTARNAGNGRAAGHQTRNARGAGQTHETCIRDKAGASDDRNNCTPAGSAAGLAAGGEERVGRPD